MKTILLSFIIMTSLLMTGCELNKQVVKSSISSRDDQLTSSSRPDFIDVILTEEEAAALKKNVEDIDFIDGWSQEIYSNIKIAEFVENDDGGTYRNGTGYDELIKKVGKPIEVAIIADETLQSKWQSEIESITVTVTYNYQTNQIINKQFY